MQSLFCRRFNRVTFLGWGFAAVIVGLLVGKQWPLFISVWFLVLLLPIVVLAFIKRTFYAFLIIVFIGLVVGVQRAGTMLTDVARYQQFIGQNVEVTGQVSEDPRYDDKRRLDFRIKNVQIEGVSLPGEVRVKALSAIGVARGDSIKTTATLREGFGNYQAAVYFARVEIANKSPHPIEVLRRAFFTGVYNAVSDPQASLGLGFLVGLKSQLPSELEEQLRILALTHIVVASGYNLTILTRISRRLLARFSKFYAFAGSVMLMLLMVFMTGMSPSMSRAAVVTFLALATWYFGRKVHPLVLIAMSGALTAWWNPLYIWHDLGWWLSFLAFIGVLVLAPMITRWLYGKRTPPVLPQIGIETLAAQIMVEPLIMMTFEQFSTLGLLANMLVVPFVPLAMLATFVAGVIGMSVPAIAGWFGVFAEYIVGFIVQIVQMLAQLSWASQEMSLAIHYMFVVYGVIVILLFVLYKKTKYRFREAPSVVD